MKKILCIVVMCMVAHITQAQFPQLPLPYDTLLGGNNVDCFTSAQRDPIDSTLIVCGYTKSAISGNHGDYDGWVVKYDSFGDTLWSVCVGTSGSEFLYSIVILPDGNYMAVGSFEPLFNGFLPPGYHGGGDILLVKIHKEGTIMWQKYIGGSLGEMANKIILEPSGTSCVIVGETGLSASIDGDFQNCTPHGNMDGFIMSVDCDNGNVFTVKLFGGFEQDRIKDVTLCGDGCFALTGWTFSNIAGNHSTDNDMWVLKIDSNHDIMWQLCVGNTGSESGWSIVESSGNLFVGGCTRSWPNMPGDILSSQLRGDADGIIAKISSTGSLQWVKTYGGTLDDFELFLTKNPYTNDLIAFGISVSSDMHLSSNSGDEDTWVFVFDQQDGIITSTIMCGKPGHEAIWSVVPLAGNHFIGVGEYAPTNYSVPWDGWIISTIETFQPHLSSVVTNTQRSSFGTFTIEPNPTSGMVRISMPPETTTNTVTIYNINGQFLFSEQTTSVIYTTDLAHLSQGTYIIEVKNDTQLFRQRVQKLL